MLSTVALAKLGADVVFFNTGFAAPQAVDVCTREGVVAMIADQEFDDVVSGSRRAALSVVGRHGGTERRRHH